MCVLYDTQIVQLKVMWAFDYSDVPLIRISWYYLSWVLTLYLLLCSRFHHQAPWSQIGITILQFLFNTLRPRQNGHHFAEDILKCIFLNENVWISHKISLNFVPKGPSNNIPLLVLIMAWRRSGDKPLSEPMIVFLPTHICVTQPQWVKYITT